LPPAAIEPAKQDACVVSWTSHGQQVTGPKDRKGDWSDHPAVSAETSRRGHRI